MLPAAAPGSHLAPLSPSSTPPPVPPAGAWQRAMAAALTDPAELLEAVGLPLPAPADLARLREAAARFGLRVPRGFVARMRRGDPDDPLLRQVLPRPEELDEVAGYIADPVGDLAVRAAPGVLHKYEGRALLVATGACAVHCRYCFRREFPYGDEVAAAANWRGAVAAITADPSITEVILSGGDPLSLSDAKLAALTGQLAALPQLRRLRLHTRQPVVLPERVDAGLLQWLGGITLPKVMVLHANHANEWSAEVRAACRRLAGAGVLLLNQAVLLRGVNDTVEAQAALAEASIEAGVLPYYLHQLDPVRGAAHFAVPDAVAQALHAALVERLPGYVVPRLVREVPGAPAKVSIAFGGA